MDDELVGVFDFDFAHAGPRIWDVAYALYRFVPMADPAQTEGFGSPREQAKRMRLFCDAYGLEDRSIVFENVMLRIQSMVDFLLEGQALGDARRIANIKAGHLRVYQHDLAYVKRHRALYEAALV
jgi:aminoglycoside phosphotransferase (APT) family kinase protein